MKNFGIWFLPVMLSAAAPAYAVAPSEVFKDVPTRHWAEQGVEEMAIKRSIMRGYEDFTFRGDLPYTRMQFATSMKELIGEIEGIAKANLKLEQPLQHNYSDVQGYDRDIVLPLANEYGLFENVPGIDPQSFHGDRALTRNEVARVINNLLRVAEKKDVVRPRQNGKNYQFSDVAQNQEVYREIQEVANHYGVMIGFPDNTFRGTEDLTRYQFAMTGYQMVPLINELVASTLEQRASEQRAATILAGTTPLPFHVEGMVGMTGGGVPNRMVPALGFRWMDTPGWFMRNDTRLQVSSGALADGNDQSGTMLDERFGVFPSMRFYGLQPYVGARGMADFYARNTFFGGLLYGLAGEWRLQPNWGLGVNLFESNLFLARTTGATEPNPMGPFYGGLSVELPYYLNSNMAITPGIDLWEAPAGYRAATPGMGKSHVFDLKLGLSWAF